MAFVGARRLVAGFAPLLLTMAACGGSTEPAPKAQAPRILEFLADPAEVEQGESTTLSWRTVHAIGLSIAVPGGEVVAIDGAVLPEGSFNVQPVGSGAYVLTAVGTDGSQDERSVEVVVLERAAPIIVSFAADRDSLDFGESTVLRWEVMGSSAVSIDDGTTTLVEDGSDRGELTVTPTGATTYRLVASEGDHTVEATVTVGVSPVIEVFAADVEGAVRVGGTVPLRWKVRGAADVEVSSPEGFSFRAQAEQREEGTIEAPMGASGRFRLVATLDGAEEEWFVEVPVLLPPTISLGATPSVVSRGADGFASIRLNWTTERAATVSLVATPGGPITIPAGSEAQGFANVLITEDTVFELVGENAAGPSTASATAAVVDLPVIEAFTALPARVPVGGDVDLEWVTSGAVRVEIRREESVLEADPDAVTGRYVEPISLNSIFTLRAYNAAGDSVERSVLATVGDMQIVRFEADRIRVAGGATVTFAWTVIGGRSLRVMGPDGEAAGCSTGSLTEIPSGSCATVVGSEHGMKTYELVVSDGAGAEVRRAVDLEIDDGPVVLSFELGASRITDGDGVEASWEVTTDSFGIIPDLEIVDDLGQVHALPQGALAGTATIHPSPGARTITLEASTSGTLPGRASAPIEVLERPVVTLSTVDAVYDPGSAEALVLEWAAAHVVALSVYRLDEGGEPIEPAVFTAPAADLLIGGGEVEVSPRRAVTYRVMGVNELGAGVEADLRISMVQASIVSFEADPETILRGGAATLSWETLGVERIEVDLPRAISVRASTLAFEDVSQSANAVTAPALDCAPGLRYGSDGCPLITFPDGFVFPFDGQLMTEARAYAKGILSFDVASAAAPAPDNASIPATDAASRFVHLAPFWDDLDISGHGIFSELRSDGGRRYFVIQWKGRLLHFVSDINFEVVLWEDGSFEYRYGVMDGGFSPATAQGEYATIGYQDLAGTAGTLVSFNQRNQNLEKSGYFFDFVPLAPAGTLAASPDADVTYTLSAYGYDGTVHTATVDVTVLEPATIVSAQAAEEDVELGQPVEIVWTTLDATSVEVSDADGIRCVAESDEVEQGSCALVETTLGARSYVVTAHGVLGSVDTRTVQATVWDPFALVSFTLDDDAIDPGNSTNLSWVTSFVDSFELTANGAPVDTSALDSGGDSIAVSPAVTTEYVLRIGKQDGRVVSQTRTLRVKRVNLDMVTQSATRVLQGESITLDWIASSSTNDPIEVTVFPSAMVELDPASAPFQDISATGEEVTLLTNRDMAVATVEFPPDFSFPYAGETHTAIVIYTDGYLSFDLGWSEYGDSEALPSREFTAIHLAPFWDDLRTSTVYVQAFDDADGERFVIQWTSAQIQGVGGSLHFQAVLFADGSFDFRYGTMSAPDQARADGGGASIGYQARAGLGGEQLLLHEAMPGGLSSRSFRFPVSRAAIGSTTVAPSKGGTIQICARSALDFECRSIEMAIVDPGDLIITELQLEPVGGLGFQWFEIRNLAAVPIDLEGLELVSGPETHVIQTGGPWLLAPKAFATFAVDAAPGFTPDYVYGAALPAFDPTGGDLSVRMNGAELIGIEWDSGWSSTPGHSLSLDGAMHVGWMADAARDSGAWCTSDASYSGANYGSPGASGSGCVYDYDVDFYASAPFIDISETGTALPDLMDDGMGMVPIPFVFEFYGGITPTTAYVSSFGWVFFDLADLYGGGIILPSPAQLGPQPGSMFHYDQRNVGGTDVLILQWSALEAGGVPSEVTFQAQLWASGDIVFGYQIIRGNDVAFGSEGSVGLLGANGAGMLLYLSMEPILYEGQSIRFSYRSTP